MKNGAITAILLCLGMSAFADNVQIGSNVYMAACPTSNAYFTNISMVNSALLADSDARTYIVAGNPDRAIAHYKLVNASVNTSSKRINYVFGAWYKNNRGIECQSLLSFEAPFCISGSSDLFSHLSASSQCMATDHD